MKYVGILWMVFSLLLYGFTPVWQKFTENKIENIIPVGIELPALDQTNSLIKLDFDVREYRLLTDNLSLPDCSKKVEEESPFISTLPEQLEDSFISLPEYKWPSFFDTHFVELFQ
tara:strand:- start:143 stop:487 length:345 start_codon:yes stop_codon:yes gene_type:complete